MNFIKKLNELFKAWVFIDYQAMNEAYGEKKETESKPHHHHFVNGRCVICNKD